MQCSQCNKPLDVTDVQHGACQHCGAPINAQQTGPTLADQLQPSLSTADAGWPTAPGTLADAMPGPNTDAYDAPTQEAPRGSTTDPFGDSPTTAGLPPIAPAWVGAISPQP